MDLLLSSVDQAQLAEAQETLLSPLSYGSVQDWGAAISAAVRRLTAGDRVAFIIPSEQELVRVAIDYDAQTQQQYPELTEPLQRRLQFLDRGVKLGAWDRRRLWSDHLDYYHRSAYYNEFIVPNCMLDAVGLAHATSPDVSVRTVAQLIVHSDMHRGAEYEGRTLQLMRLILPAFRAGVDVCGRFHRGRIDLMGAIDALSDGLLLSDDAGRIVHQSRGAMEILRDDPEAGLVFARASELARTNQSHGARKASARVDTNRRSYHLVLARITLGLLDRTATSMIYIRQNAAGQPPKAELCSRFALTERQADIALLLSQRASNTEIAVGLGISVHTVKRHTEQVLHKLGLRSRTEVAAAIQPPDA